jgi:hypothetical protein
MTSRFPFVDAAGSAAPAKLAGDPELAGKLVIVTLTIEKRSMVLGNVRVKCLGTREFLVGEYVDLDDAPPFEATYWLPLDQVEFLMECKDKEAVKTVYDSRPKGEKKE